MAAPTVLNAVATNPGGTGSTITVALSTHAVDDLLVIYIANTGNTLWAGNPAGWNRLDQRSVGTSSNGIVGTWFWRKVVSGDMLPLASPVFTLGATVTRAAACRTVRGADLESPFVTVNYGARGFATGTSNPARPPSVTTLAPEMLILHCYGSRAATNAPEPSGYTQDAEVVISGTLALNASSKTEANQNTAETNQDASPTSGARWAAGILCIPGRDYPYYRSGSQAIVTNGTSVNPVLPAGTSSSNAYGAKDLVIATVEAAGDNVDIQPNIPADWTEITGFATNTSGNGTTIRKYWALYDGSLDDVFTRPTNGELSICLTTYYNVHQTTPIGAVNVRQNASSTTSTWDALTRTSAKCVMTATCVADGTPTYTAPAGWTERMDGLGIGCADQTFNATGSTASASFTLGSASPTAVGLVEIINASASVPTTVTPNSLSFATARFTPVLNLATVPSTLNLTVSTFASAVIKAATVIPSTAPLTLLALTPLIAEKVTPSVQPLILNAFAISLSTETAPSTQSLSLTSFAPTFSLTRLVEPTTIGLSLDSFAPVLLIGLTPSVTNAALTTFTPSIVTSVAAIPDLASLIIDTFAPLLTDQVVPASTSLMLNPLVPILEATAIPPIVSLTLASFSLGLRESVTPDVFMLTLAAFSPDVPVVAVPSLATLTITALTPSVNITDQSTVIPAVASLVIATFDPLIVNNAIITAQPAVLTVSSLAPRLDFYVTALTTSLTVSGTVPSLLVDVMPMTASLALTAFTSAVIGADQDVIVIPDIDVLLLTTSVINLHQFVLRGSVSIGSENSIIQIGAEGRRIDISFENHAV